MENDVENPLNGWGTSEFSPEYSKNGSSISMYGVNRSFVGRRNIFILYDLLSYNRDENMLHFAVVYNDVYRN